ncbi:L-threonylcarbamoyladenylate synthase [Collinsella ihumii]|uniref:L-threonylcarbamoyladenylate synthase n=1 Tax=Collinsella ihumii TaxID=1720204 RepID=A0ABT7XEW0_9ACTN|nr:L-threonylcarbamoyladenylate synthase [Collinsella ihumii]MBM6689424.1 threonylcarbamoyl-AMP synthase [Collinsella tanakaei]MBM6904833.1 threonylcarbamoyl-AMP synthase [Collinsella tanakaei]MDN0063952.1 L-threonylcarbamoyladenylate synthase [Collinsella ihumii]
MQRIYRVGGGSGPHPLAIRDAAQVLTAGGLILTPTETVYGIGVAIGAYASSGDEAPAPATGYGRIFTLKRRDVRQTVPWLVAGERDLDAFGVDVPEGVHVLARAFWPGALTLIVKASDRVPRFMRAADGTVALRASASPVVQALVRACGSPLAVTSANTHGAPAPASFAQVEARILAGVDAAIDAGETVCHDASTIVSLLDGELDIIRQGALSAADIESALASCSVSYRKVH